MSFLDDEEVRPFVEDPSLQLMIQYQIQEDQERLAQCDYQYDQKEFPTLVDAKKMNEINRK